MLKCNLFITFYLVDCNICITFVPTKRNNNPIKYKIMNYSAKQIENAKRNYTSFLKVRTVESFEPQYVGYNVAEQRCEFHNNIVNEILNGNVVLEKEWKLFFLNEEVKADQKADEKKAKLNANKEASADVLAPIKAAKKIGEFGKWLNTPGNPFRKEHFSKKYTQESVNAFLSL
jgi:hypothetical protein